MSEDLLTEQYETAAEADEAQRRHWQEGWLVRTRSEVDVEDELELGNPGPYLPTLLGSLVIAMRFWATRSRRPTRRMIQIVYERADGIGKP